MSRHASASEIIDALYDGKREAIEPILEAAVEAAGTEIAIACALGDEAAVARLITADPTCATAPTGPRAYAPLLYVAHSRICHAFNERAPGMGRIARQLLAHGADVNTSYFEPAFPSSPLSALYVATGIADNPEVARALLEAGANTIDGESIYHAAEANHRECLELLLQHGADLSMRQEPWGNTPLYFLLGYRESDAKCATATEGVRWLLEHGADPNVTSYAVAETPLHLAVRNRRSTATLTMLLAHGANPNARRADGRTPYQLAVRHGYGDAVRLLAERGAGDEVTLADRFVGAAMSCDEDLVRTMLNDDPGAVRLLGADDTAMIVEAAVDNSIDAVRLMLNVGFDIAARGEAGATALHHAAWRGHRGLVELLLGYDPPLDVRCSSYEGTPLDWAVHGSANCRGASDSDYVAITEAIIAAGGDPAHTPPAMGTPAVADALLRHRT